MTLNEAISLVEQHKDDGFTCPCCSQFVKRYKRKITSAMAYGLILIHKESKGNWIHLREFFTERNIRTMNDLPTLVHWGLIEKSDDQKSDGNPDSGMYRITKKGILFVEKMIMVPRFCYIFNNNATEFSVEPTNIEHALGDKFNYSELMPHAFLTDEHQLLLL